MSGSKISLKSIINKMRTIADDHYDSDVHNNALAIFNKLPINERKILIEDLIHISVIINERKFLKDSTPDIEEEDQKNIIRGVEDPEYINKIELIKLKSWLTKAVVIGIILAILVVVLGSVAMGYIDKLPDFFTTIKNILNIIFIKE